jgi:alanine racemase
MQATRALIHLGNLRHNIESIRALLAPGVELCPMVKANAYGHGAVIVASAATAAGVRILGVAGVDEGLELREAGITVPIIVLRNLLPDEADAVVAAQLVPFVADEDGIGALEAAARRAGRKASAHLKVDTGMGRVGCRPAAAAALARRLAASACLRLEGVCTHFAGADMAQREYTDGQIRAFLDCLGEIRAAGVDPGVVHASNTGGVLGFAEAHFGMVRVGLALYGYSPLGASDPRLELRPVMELVTRVAFLKQVEAGSAISYGMTWRAARRTHIATLPAGYADGYSRKLSNAGEVWIKGRRYPVVGRVCMDQCMVDLGPETDVRVGDTVTLFGPGGGRPDAVEIARLMDTIPYEVTCLITRRVPRVAVE